MYICDIHDNNKIFAADFLQVKWYLAYHIPHWLWYFMEILEFP